MLSIEPSEQFILKEDFILVGEETESREEILGKMVGILTKNRYVKDNFLQALLTRERTYPTGLQTNTIGVAIPHTDSEYVITPTLAIATLSSPVMFKAMDNPQKDIPVELIIIMAIKNSSRQLEALSLIMEIFQDEETMTAIHQAHKAREILQVIDRHFSSAC